MPVVIAVINGKGGVGKTTVSINLAQCLAREKGSRVGIGETDPQESIRNVFNAEKCLFDVIALSTEREVYSVRKLMKSWDYVIIDGAAAISAISSAAVIVADLVIIPVTPSPLDFSACGAILAVLEARQNLTPVVARFLITKKIESTQMLAILRDSITTTGIPALKTQLSQRQSYVRALIDGGTIYDTADSKAKGEIDVLTNEILGVLS